MPNIVSPVRQFHCNREAERYAGAAGRRAVAAMVNALYFNGFRDLVRSHLRDRAVRIRSRPVALHVIAAGAIFTPSDGTKPSGQTAGGTSQDKAAVAKTLKE